VPDLFSFFLCEQLAGGLLGEGFFVSEVNACFIPLRGSPEVVNCEVRQQYPLLLTRHLLQVQ
jgi:hypothetical protein